MPGRVGNVADWYMQSDLYVLSSRVEGLSNTLLAAMASGLATVAFDCETGPREIVRNGIDGVLGSPPAASDEIPVTFFHLMAIRPASGRETVVWLVLKWWVSVT